MTEKNGGKNGRPERDENGRFVRGNPGGPGRPRKEACISDLMQEYLERETLVPGRDKAGRRRKIKTTYLRLFVESQVTRAINGDAAAAKNVWERIEGRVPLPIEAEGDFNVTVTPPDPDAFTGTS